MDKIALRRYYKDLRSHINEEYAKKASELVIKNLTDYIKPKSIKAIAGYYPINNELNILDLLELLHQTGYSIALPASLDDLSLEFRAWHPMDRLQMHDNFMQPLKNKDKIIPDLIIAPILGADIYGNRLGYGKGCYDRTISIYRQLNPSVTVVGLCYATQIQSIPLPTQSHDQKLDAIITEKSTTLYL